MVVFKDLSNIAWHHKGKIVFLHLFLSGSIVLKMIVFQELMRRIKGFK